MSKGAIIGLAVGVVTVIVLIFVFTGGDTPESLIEETKILTEKCSARELSPQECTDGFLDLGTRWTEVTKDMSSEELIELNQKWQDVYGGRKMGY